MKFNVITILCIAIITAISAKRLERGNAEQHIQDGHGDQKILDWFGDWGGEDDGLDDDHDDSDWWWDWWDWWYSETSEYQYQISSDWITDEPTLAFSVWNDPQFVFEQSCSYIVTRKQVRQSHEVDATNSFECGVKPNVAESSVDSGASGIVESANYDWPWLVALGYKNTGPFCSGTLIGDQFVLTSARCFKEIEYPCDWNVRLGEHNLNVDEGLHADVAVEDIFIHPQYNTFTKANDIAIVKLAEKLVNQTHIGSACLPENMAHYQNTNCYVAGWGTATDLGVISSGAVKHVSVPLISKDECVSIYGDCVYPGMMCVGVPKKSDYSHNDNVVGPLVCQNGNHWDAVAAPSWGLSEQSNPAVYSSFVEYMPWIRVILASQS